MPVVFGNWGLLYRLGHCFPLSFRHPQRTPSETKLLYQKLCWHFPSMTYLSLSWFLFFFLAFPKLQDTCYYSVVSLITLKPSVKTSMAVELSPPILLLWEKFKDKIGLLLVEKPHIEDISKLNFQFIFFPWHICCCPVRYSALGLFPIHFFWCCSSWVVFDTHWWPTGDHW